MQPILQLSIVALSRFFFCAIRHWLYNYLWCLEDLLQSDDVRMVQSLEHLHLPGQHQDTPAARLCVCVYPSNKYYKCS